MDYELLENLKNTGMGWLNPEGKIIPCRIHEHLDMLKDCVDGYDDLKAIIEEIDYVEEHWNEDTPDEHPEWHMFEIYHEGKREDARNKIMTEAYRSGWIRLGLWGNGFEAEGQFDKKSESILNEIATMLNLELHLRKVS